ncbi:MAG TPA: transposase [Asanoa sp.]
MSGSDVISDELWAVIEPVLPRSAGRRGRPWNDHRRMLEAIAWRFRTGSPWRDLPKEYGPWQSAWERHRRWSTDGTYTAIFTAMRAHAAADPAEAEGSRQLLAVVSTGVRARRLAPDARRHHAPTVARGVVGRYESARRTR